MSDCGERRDLLGHLLEADLSADASVGIVTDGRLVQIEMGM